MVQVIDVKYIGPPIFRAHNVHSFHGKNNRDLIVPREIEYRQQYNNEIRGREPLKVRQRKNYHFRTHISRRRDYNER